MNSKFKNVVFGGLVAGTLIVSAGPVMAWDWPWANRYERYERRTENRDWNHYHGREWDSGWGRGRDYQEWEQAHQQALYDAAHGASRKKIAEDNARADEILERHHRR